MQYLQGFTSFINYFKAIRNDSTYFKFFQTGGTEKIISDRLLDDLRSRVEYPMLFLEWPDITLNDYGSSNTQTNFRAAFVVLEDPAKDDWDAQDAAMQRTYEAVHQVLQQMLIDSTGLNKKLYNVDLNKVSIAAIDNLFIDTACGWRCEFEIRNPINLGAYPFCRNPTFWGS